MLWENCHISERTKFNAYNARNMNSYFWRTYDQQEIDLFEEKNAGIEAFEFKWKEEKSKAPAAFAKAFPDAAFKTITSNNYLDFIS